MLFTAAKGSFPKDRWPLYGRLFPLKEKDQEMRPGFSEDSSEARRALSSFGGL